MKPAGVAVHATRGAVAVPMLQRVRDAVRKRVYPLHRLDAPTSGALAFALDPEAAGALSQCFARGEVEKRYVALVRGVPPPSGRIDHPIPREEGGPRVPSATSFRTLFTLGRYSLVLAEPHTGRRHQIRRHLRHESWPIIGDVNYGKGEHNRLFRERFGLHRLALHALELAVPGVEGSPGVAPIAAFSVRAPLPPDLAAPLASFGVPSTLLEALCGDGEWG